jgi:hypothetical protein
VMVNKEQKMSRRRETKDKWLKAPNIIHREREEKEEAKSSQDDPLLILYWRTEYWEKYTQQQGRMIGLDT